MSFYADPLLREARERVKSLPNQTAASTPDSPDFGYLAEAIEKAIKAALIESHGSLPKQHDHDQLVSICQSTGVWDVLPPALRGLIQEVEAYRSPSSSPTALSSPVESSREQIQKYFVAARRLIDYMEFHIIGNDSVLKRLKVA